MAVQRWLSIVVDGNSALGPYWPTIVSDYLQNIIRCFCGSSREQGANNSGCELGLVMYNANSDLGCDVQFIHWTKDVDQFIDMLSGLAFNGDDLDQFTMAEGLAEALLMYPRPPGEYLNGERHCIVVAGGDPVPMKMTVSVPKINFDGEFVGTQIETCKANFLEVAQMFIPLAVSLSVITPKQLPIFREIFNVANVSGIANATLSNYRSGQFIVLLSKNFKEARHAFHGKRILDSWNTEETNLESEKATTDIPFPEVNPTLPEDLFLLGTREEQHIGQQTIEAAKAVLVPQNQKTTDQSRVSSSNSSISSMTEYGDIMAEADELNANNNEIRNMYSELKGDNLKALFDPNQLISFDDIGYSPGRQPTSCSDKRNICLESLLSIEAEFKEALWGNPHNMSESLTPIIGLTSHNSSQEVVVPTSATPTSSAEIISPNILQEPRGNHCTSTSSFLPQQYSSSSQLAGAGPQADYGGVQSTDSIINTAARHQGFDGQITDGVELGSMYPHAMANSTIMQPFSSSGLQMFSHDMSSHLARGPILGSFSGQFMRQNLLGYNRDPITTYGASSSWVPRILPQRFHPAMLPRPPSMDNEHDYVHTWEGTISGIVETGNFCTSEAKAYRRTTSPISLTVQWLRGLQFHHFIPVRALNHTLSITREPVDYVVFEIMSFNNVDLYDFLRSRNLCARIELMSQVLILSPTPNPYRCVGTVFPAGTIFLEPAGV